MDASGRDLSETYLRGFFEPGEVREVLGMRLVNDPERAERVFPEYRAGRQPRVFVEDPGPSAEAPDSVLPGDAAWLLRGDSVVARYHDIFLPNVASLVVGIVDMHHPRLPRYVTICSGGERLGDGASFNGTFGVKLRYSRKQLAGLRAVRDALVGNAARRRLTLVRAEKRYNREDGPYWRQILLRRAAAIACRVLGLQQYWCSRLLHEFCCAAPWDVVVAWEGEGLRYEPVGPDGEGKARRIARAMRPYEHGSGRWFLWLLRKWAKRSVTRPLDYRVYERHFDLRVRMLPRWRAHVTVTEREPDGAEPPRPACRARPTSSA
ncbi:MAG: hypothetical protein ACYSU0_10295 [Planctomycetota bacterium]|jgi:hypothetical protein